MEIAVPKFGDVMESGLITTWLKQDGDWVNVGDPLFEMETDKTNATVESVGSGYIKHLVPEGTEVEVGGVVAILSSTEPESNDGDVGA